MIDSQRVTSNLMDLLAISSPSLHERAVGDRLTEMLRDIGLKVEKDGAGVRLGGDCDNLIVRIPGTVPEAPALMLNSHIDTVVPCIGVRPRLDDGIIRSDGTTVLGGDCKTGVVAILEILRQLQDGGCAHGDVEAVFTVAEEIGLLGARELDYSLLHARQCLVFDGGVPIGQATVSAPSQKNLIVKCIGKAAHAGVCPETGISAIRIAARAIDCMSLGRIDFETTANVGVIHGGEATNIVTELVELKAEARSRDEGKLDAQVQQMVSALEEAADFYRGRAEIEVKESYRAFRLAPDHLLCRAITAAAADLGIAGGLVDGGGGSDANVFNTHGIDSVILNCGERDVHTTAEHVVVQDVVDAVGFGLQVISQLARV